MDIKIKKKVHWGNILLVFSVILIITINFNVFLAAKHVKENQQGIQKRYNEYIDAKETAGLVKIILDQKIYLKKAYEVAKESKIIIFNEETQNKLNNINSLSQGKKVVYLTFDDGPSRAVTPHILEILKQNDVKATFFILGTMGKYYPDLIKQEYDEGHYIANHGYSHVYSKIYESKEAFLEEIEETEKVIRKALNDETYKSHLFRYPGGAVGGKYNDIKQEFKQVLAENEYGYIDWNALTRDSEGKFTKEELIENAKKTCSGKNTVVLLMHDAGNKITTYEALNDIILYLKEEGYEFRTFYDVMK